MNNFVKRTLSGIGFAAVMLAAFLTNKYIFGAVMLFSLVVMMWEFLQMTCGKNYRYSQILSILSGATLFILTKTHSEDICTDIRSPDYSEETEQKYSVEIPFCIKYSKIQQ